MRLEEKAKFLEHAACPKCGSSDARAIYSNGSSYCFSCGTYFAPGEIEEDEGVIEVKEPEEIQEPQRFTPVPLNYADITNRKLSAYILQKYSMGIYRENGQLLLVANYFSPTGDIVAQHFRTTDKQFFWRGSTKSLPLFGSQTKDKSATTLVITEGEIDACSVAQCLPPVYTVVSVPNGAQSAPKYIKENLGFIEEFQKVILWFDNDEPGREAKRKALEILDPEKSYVIISERKDANEVLVNDGPQKIKELVMSAQKWKPEDLRTIQDIPIDNLINTPPELVYYTSYEGLNRFLNGFRMNELVVIGAGTGVGKSTFLRHLAYDLLVTYPELRIGYLAFEETNEMSTLGFIARDNQVKLGDLFLDRTIISEENFKKSYNKFKDRIVMMDHFGFLSPEKVIQKIKEIVKIYDTQFIFLDHITMLTYGIDQSLNERRAIDSLLNQLRILIKSLNIGVIAVSHLNMKGEEHHEEGGRVTLEHFRGSGSIKQLADVVIGLERNTQASNLDARFQTKVRILKDRLYGNTGVCSIIDGRSGVLRETQSFMLNQYQFEDETEKTEEEKDTQNTTFEEDF